jgi:hypothetical protein
VKITGAVFCAARQVFHRTFGGWTWTLFFPSLYCSPMSSKLEAASLNEEEWTRSEDFQTDMLRAFQCGEFYNCTFQVYSKDGDKKVS